MKKSIRLLILQAKGGIAQHTKLDIEKELLVSVFSKIDSLMHHESFHHKKNSEAASRGVIRERCSENIQQMIQESTHAEV